MFTIKLKGRNVWTNLGQEECAVHKTLLVEAASLEIHHLRLHELAEIECDNAQGHHVFYIADPDKPRPDGFAQEIFFWDFAYIENANGRTTEVIDWKSLIA